MANAADSARCCLVQAGLHAVGSRKPAPPLSNRVMDKQRLAQALSAWLFCTLLVPTAYAEGAVSFNDNIVPMLKDRPQFKEFILQSFSVADTGWGVRIDSPTMPHMGGARMGPYRFQAIWHSPHGGTPITLVIDTKTEFFDKCSW